VVKLSDADDSFRTGQKPADIAPDFRAAIGKIPHGAGVPPVHPVLVTFEIVRRFCRSDTSKIEPALLGDAFYGIGSQLSG